MKTFRLLLAWLVLFFVMCGCSALLHAESGDFTNTSYREFNVRDFGAKGDGKALDSIALNAAIDACFVAGEGTVRLTKGIYLCGSIHLASHVHLQLDAGAVIMGASKHPEAFDLPEPYVEKKYQDDGHTYFHNSLIWGENLKDVAITGKGTINGGGLISGDDIQGRADKALALKNCQNVVLRDVTFAHGPHFAILATGCNRMTIDHLTIDTDRDGMDLDCCLNTTITNCRVNTPTDDGICPKSTNALGHPVITENMTIANCQVSGFKEGTLIDGTNQPANGVGRIKLGTESTGGFRNITISNCTFLGCRGLALEEVDGGLMENITVDHLTMTDLNSYAIYVTLGSRNRGPAPGTSTMRNISISHVEATGVDRRSGIQIHGLPGHPIEGLRLSDIRMTFHGGGTAEEATRVPPELAGQYPDPEVLGSMPAYGFYARHVKDLQLTNIRFTTDTPDQRPALVCEDIDGLTITNFEVPKVAGVMAARFKDVSEKVILNSPSLEGSSSNP